MRAEVLAKQRTSTGKSAVLNYLALFTSFGTLLCCAPPSLVALLGLGATVASLLSAVPWLVTLARYREILFIISGNLLAGDFVYVYWLSPRLKAQGRACPTEDGPTLCDMETRMSRIVLWVAAVIFTIGFFSAYALGPILTRIG